MPWTLVHCLISSSWFCGATVASDVPWKIATRGYVPVNDGSAARTRSPHCAGVFSSSGWLFIAWQAYAPLTVVAHRYGMPELIAPALNTSGHVASITAAIAPPDENPAT